jgi:hypothetical protein
LPQGRHRSRCNHHNQQNIHVDLRLACLIQITRRRRTNRNA